MRVWLYDTLTQYMPIQDALGGPTSVLERIMPRSSRTNINVPKPFMIYGLGNNTNEDLGEESDHEAHRQFFQIWIHDEGGDYSLIDSLIVDTKNALRGQSSPAHNVMAVHWLETSGEFNNETYNTLFRYVRFQAIIGKGALL